MRRPVFAILEEVLPERTSEGENGKADPDTGPPGMLQWQILVLGILRLGFNAEYDRIQELANQHNTLRKMLGHSDWADKNTTNSRPSRTTCDCSARRSWTGSIGKWFVRGIKR
ncbi:MAG: hypothetical protein KZQ63_05355 [Candidatus Thiodiazotropha sp. (ex Lucinoma aequizonata)]|nr:hypothetical protein [Candidatus Thiodiazotropha sp. (ex Lucinoma aequizonata)]